MITKNAVHTACMVALEQRLAMLKSEIRSLQESAEEETKSSAGDKYETAREMIEAEKEKLAERLEETSKFYQTMRAISLEPATSVHTGSLVQTENGWMYLSVGLGTVEVEGHKIFVISPVAPIVQAMLGKKQGETFTLGGKSQSIRTLL